MNLKRAIILPVMSLVSISLFSCNNKTNNNEDNKETLVALDEVINKLSSAYELEVNNSNKVKYKEVIDKTSSKEVIDEETTIYNDEMTISNGTRSLTYKKENKTISDNYLKFATVGTYRNSESSTDTFRAFFLITDYEKNGSEASTWIDSSYQLPVYKNGKDSEDGLSYLLEKSVPGQLSKQASLYTSNFIDSNLVNNIDLNASGANIKAKKIIKDNNFLTYSLTDYSYSYTEEGINTKISYSFEVYFDNLGRFISSNYSSYTGETRGDNDKYEVNVNYSYEVSYEDRTSSTTLNETRPDPMNYYLTEVKEVSAYYFDNGQKIYCEFDALPIEKYIKFEAKTYSPSKAIDLTMSVKSIDNSTSYELSGDALYIKDFGDANIVLESNTGISFNISVKVARPKLTKLTFSDTYSGAISGDKNKVIFTNTTYNKLRVNVYPSVNGVDYNDIKVKLSDDSLATINKVEEGKGFINYQLSVNDIKESKDLVITFYSESNPDIKVSVTYTIKVKLTDEELVNKVLSSTYRYKSIYDRFDGVMKFSSKTNGTIEYYNRDTNELISSTQFTYSISGTTFNINITSDNPSFGYTEGEITLDGELITLSVNLTDYVHKFNIEA